MSDLTDRAQAMLGWLTLEKWTTRVTFEGEVCLYAGNGEYHEATNADAAFIEDAPELVRTLIAEVEARGRQMERLTAEVDALRTQVAELEEGNWPFEWTVATEEREKRKAAEARMKLMQDPPKRITELESLLHMLTDDVNGAGFRRMIGPDWHCGYCGVNLTQKHDHDEHCPVTRARRLLSGE